jgi:hypothetical protein
VSVRRVMIRPATATPSVAPPRHPRTCASISPAMFLWLRLKSTRMTLWTLERRHIVLDAQLALATRDAQDDRTVVAFALDA